MSGWAILGSASAVILLAALAYRAREWFIKALSETDGSPSTSRLVAFMTALVNLGTFIGWGTYQVMSLHQQPDLAAWGSYMGWSQAGGSMPYIFNQIRRAATERVAAPSAPATSP